ncbi:MAG: glucose-1-phosphate cytidylyltransferase [Acidobacteria bacterium]|nr:MAG: glucose-1-phosphate cytidylyltransferase [Acidobacteriota bacterium]REK01169.1 MAG: glucose-1-phosphate cytidylyltransferase [Acidobacteriota bacterium]REK14125.1 MAG: glucose-1-phosphate cytidylyltransferase [Acidobacteriota bacterium]REK44840.1 MAG: glucose-1-phosphate cytidylyltransferase [Acidobacteriota bacterium]
MTKTVILAGGFGTRLAEETSRLPKPMVEIGGKPLLWHIMKIYASHGFSDFLVACGYKGDYIKEYFHSFAIRSNDYFVDLHNGTFEVVNRNAEEWSVGMIDTGLNTMTGGRVLRLRDWLKDATFMLTYGDGLGNVDVNNLLEFHKSRGKLATVTAVRPPARFGALTMEGDLVQEFTEKSQVREGWINGGFFVCEPKVLDYISDDKTVFERDPLENLAAEGQLAAYRHDGFWQPMDTLREKQLLEALWENGDAPWATWLNKAGNAESA